MISFFDDDDDAYYAMEWSKKLAAAFEHGHALRQAYEEVSVGLIDDVAGQIRGGKPSIAHDNGEVHIAVRIVRDRILGLTR